MARESPPLSPRCLSILPTTTEDKLLLCTVIEWVQSVPFFVLFFLIKEILFDDDERMMDDENRKSDQCMDL